MDLQEQKAMLEAMEQDSRGSAIIDGKEYHADGYKNMLNKYGTRQDNSTAYRWSRENITDDMTLTSLYEGNGLFAKIIDRPAEESVKHGLEIDYGDEKTAEYVDGRLDQLGWEDSFATAEKWARLYGGAIIVMLVDDGRGIDEPLNWKAATSIEELRVFERAVVQPDYTSLYNYHFFDSLERNRVYGEPEFYQVFSMYGYFRVHRSRCLVFRNGKLPENTTTDIYRYWGMPEYVRIKKALRECITSHEDGVKLLERSSQAVYSMKGLANMLATEQGENMVINRMQVIDMARNILNTIAIDSDGEAYEFKTMTMSGAKDIIDETCNMLSAVTAIPQSILFGKSPSGMDSTGESDLENYYNMVENIQKLNMKKNTRTVIDLILKQGRIEGKIDSIPTYKVQFSKLWSMSEQEQADIEAKKAETQAKRAQTAQIYIEAQVLDPSEVRKTITDDEDFDIEIDESANPSNDDLDVTEEELAYAIANQKDLERRNDSKSEYRNDSEVTDKKDITDKKEFNDDGGPGSGNYGHEGRKGKRGGSAPGGGKAYRLSTPDGGFTSRAQAEKEDKERSKAKESTGSAEKKQDHKIVDGKDISSTYKHRDSYKFEIEDVIDQQGFNGKPQIKSGKEFEDAVKESNFVAQRTYSAPSQEILDEYRKQNLDGEWYVDCSTGGAQYGQGMYCAADYTGTISEGIKAEMKHYQELNDTRFGKPIPAETRIKEHIKLLEDKGIEVTPTMKEFINASYTGDVLKTHELANQMDRNVKRSIFSVETKSAEAAPNIVETFTLDKTAKIVKYDDIYKRQQNEGNSSRIKAEIIKNSGLNDEELALVSDAYKSHMFGHSGIFTYEEMKRINNIADKLQSLPVDEWYDKYDKAMAKVDFSGVSEAVKQGEHLRKMDIGAYAALKGYDAINAEGHGESGSYTVILNRTKVIYKGD